MESDKGLLKRRYHLVSSSVHTNELYECSVYPWVTHSFSMTGKPGFCYQNLLRRVNSVSKVRPALTTRRLSPVTLTTYYFSVGAFNNLLKNKQIYQTH